MAMNGVPLYIGGDQASHTAENARVGQFVQFSGDEGVVLGGDLKVTEGTLPGSFVMINPGACAILARGPQQHRQMYSWGFGTAMQLAIPANTSGSPRYHLVIMRVEDPHDGTGQWPVPADPANGPYIHPRVITDVPANTTSVHDLAGTHGVMSAITLARIRVPATTETIVDDYVTHLRTLSAALERSRQLSFQHGSLESVDLDTGWQYVPSTADTTIQVPSFATTLDIDMTCKSMRVHSPQWSSQPNNLTQMFGRISVDIDGVIQTGHWWNNTMAGPYDDVSPGVVASVDVSDKQGEMIRLRAVHQVVGGDAPGIQIQAHEHTASVFHLQFRQEII